MNILINCSNLKVGGGLQVAHSFMHELRKYPQHTYTLIISPKLSEIINTEDFERNFTFIPYKMKFMWSSKNAYLDSLVIKHNIIVIFTVFGPSYWKSKVINICGYAIPHYIYQDSPYFKNLSYQEKIRLYLFKKIQSQCFIKNSNKLIFETNDARIRFCQKFKYNINDTFVVPNTLNQIFRSPNFWKNRKFNFNASTKILCLGANYLHKNWKIIPQVIDSLLELGIDNFKLVISLTKKQLSFNDKYDKYIEYLGYVELEALPFLYQSVDVLFMPTLLEVFSATYLEAMFMKIPIVTSDLTFAHDVCNDSAIYFNPTDPKDGALKLKEVITNEFLRKILIEKGNYNLERFGTSKDRTEKYLSILINSIVQQK